VDMDRKLGQQPGSGVLQANSHSFSPGDKGVEVGEGAGI
jgi:hypothetical protein